MHEERLDTRPVHCPYCDMPFDLMVDVSQGSQETWEDCPHCCAPIQLRIAVSLVDGELEEVSLGVTMRCCSPRHGCYNGRILFHLHCDEVSS